MATPTSLTSRLELDNGVSMPALGLGVFQSPPDETADAVATALDLGYRLIDTAAVYGNERQVGEGLRASGVDRDDVFLETKVWVSDYGSDKTEHAWEKAVRKLGTDRLDLLILHTPAPTRFDATVEAYLALERLLEQGKVRAIGVSNFMPHHLDRLLAEASVVPAVNQIELHPYFTQPEVRAVDREHGILDQAWSPIGGITFYPGYENEHTSALEDPTIVDVAERAGRTPAQVMLRWHLQHGRSVIPKSVRPERIRENGEVFDFDLDEADMAALDGLDTGRRGGPDPDSDRADLFDRAIPEE